MVQALDGKGDGNIRLREAALIILADGLSVGTGLVDDAEEAESTCCLGWELRLARSGEDDGVMRLWNSAHGRYWAVDTGC